MTWTDMAAAVLACPKCRADLSFEEAGGGLRCRGCALDYAFVGDIPDLYVADPERPVDDTDLTEKVNAFYERDPFPNYDDFDSPASLAAKARKGEFARRLDEAVPTGARVLDCGCGTGQLTNFLSIANREVYGADLTVSSMRIASEFARRHGLARAHFLRMNLFSPPFADGSFDLVVSNGVLHHTLHPKRAFLKLSRLVAPGGYIAVGLYHRYGRIWTNLRRRMIRSFGRPAFRLDPNLRASGPWSDARKQAWLADQYFHPHESTHDVGEVAGWIDEAGLAFVRSLPDMSLVPRRRERLFEALPLVANHERQLAELGQVFSGHREGGFFIAIAKRPA